MRRTEFAYLTLTGVYQMDGFGNLVQGNVGAYYAYVLDGSEELWTTAQAMQEMWKKL